MAAKPREKAVLLGVMVKGTNKPSSAKASLEELALLARTAGVEVVGAFQQHLTKPNPLYYLGKGKVEELAALKSKLQYDVLIFDGELSPSQQRNLEERLQVKIVDRPALILDIFAQRAYTREGRLQVELAQYEYLLPRLTGRWKHLERLGGGIGTRGPGESQLETDRRLVSQKIHRLKLALEEVRQHRALYRRRRSRQGIPVISLVGYTNAGKSTLLNALSQAKVLVEDKLFSTLDPTTRRLSIPGGKQVLLTDTVGFIQRLPPSLVAAFRATLEELEEASLLLHVVDITQERAAEQSETVEEILAELGLAHKPRIAALNKIDLLLEERELSRYEAWLRESGQKVALVSAARGWGLESLLCLVAEALGEAEASLHPTPPVSVVGLVQVFKQYAPPLDTAAPKMTPERVISSV